MTDDLTSDDLRYVGHLYRETVQKITAAGLGHPKHDERLARLDQAADRLDQGWTLQPPPQPNPLIIWSTSDYPTIRRADEADRD